MGMAMILSQNQWQRMAAETDSVLVNSAIVVIRFRPPLRLSPEGESEDPLAPTKQRKMKLNAKSLKIKKIRIVPRLPRLKSRIRVEVQLFIDPIPKSSLIN